MLEGRRAVVTGGASGIGREICRKLGNAGADVVVADLREGPVDGSTSVADHFRGIDAEYEYVQTDVTDEESVAALFETVSERGGADILVNNAGVTRFGSVTETTAEDWATEVAVNLTGVFHCCKHGVPVLTENDASSVVSISSVYGIRGGIGNFGYSATKGAVVALTKQLAVEFGRDGLRANAVAPGFIDSRMLRDDTPPGTAEWAVENTPQDRLGTMGEVARVVRFLASQEASFVTGQLVAVDGGFTTR